MIARRYVMPGMAGVALAAWISAEAQEQSRPIEVCRHSAAEGRAADPFDIARVENFHRRTAAELSKALRGAVTKVSRARLGGHHSGVLACRAPRQRIDRLKDPAPPPLRQATLFFVNLSRGGNLPRVPLSLPREAEVFVLETESVKDALALSKALGQRVSLATREFTSALGVKCAPCRVTFDPDGHSAIIREELP